MDSRQQNIALSWLLFSMWFLIGSSILLIQLREDIYSFLESTKLSVIFVVSIFTFLGANLGYFEIKYMSQALNKTDVSNMISKRAVLRGFLMLSLLVGLLLGVDYATSTSPQALTRASFLLMMAGLGLSIMSFILFICSYFAKYHQKLS